MFPILVEKLGTSKHILACCVCEGPLTWIHDPSLSEQSAATSALQCSACKKTYFGNETYLDLTVATVKKTDGTESMPLRAKIFRTSLVSYLYERGWRQSFNILAGFPGLKKEFELAKGYLKPVLGGNIVDASCGTGLFSRHFARSGLFSLVIALDYSENMLRQCYKFMQKENNFPSDNLVLVRADISKLPFASNTIDAVHAGAAFHCWPSPSAAVAEITRVLRPGGVFVATTFMFDGHSSVPLFGTIRQTFTQRLCFRFLESECQLEDLCNASGLVDFRCVKNRQFVMISATKSPAKH